MKWRLGLHGCEAVASDGFSGGLALFWDDSIQVQVLGKSNRYIDVCIQEARGEPPWHATFVYGEPRVQNRHLMWATFSDLKVVSNLPWVVMGDFNEALWQHKHFSSNLRPEAQMMAFRDALAVCEFDLGFCGTPYTYDNHQRGDMNVRVRLDRACADVEWQDLFPNASVDHLTSSRSDHCPLLLRLHGVDAPRPGGRTQRYELMWDRSAALPEIVSNAWEKAAPTGSLESVSASLSSVMDDLKAWSKCEFGHVLKELEEIRQELCVLEASGADRAVLKQKCDRMDELLYREEMMWLQCSRIAWLKEGDRNTRYFHQKAVWRARKNHIKKLNRQDGVWCTVPSDMERMANSYFWEVYTKDPTLDPATVLDLLGVKVSQELNDELCREFTEKEVPDALFQMGPLKALGPDGFPVRIYQKNWGTL